MKVVIVGSGIAGMSAAIESVNLGNEVVMISQKPSEQSQSVMAAGGINAVGEDFSEHDSIESHAQDTFKGGCFIEDIEDLRRLCGSAPGHIKFIEEMGVVFSRDEDGKISRRAFGGQSHKRTAYAGSSTGKQIVTAMIQKCREYEYSGKLERIVGLHFHSALIKDGACFGVLMMDALTGELHPFYGDALIIATGGQNKLFGKTTGTEICDGFVTGKLLSQGVRLRNLEFIQYHPTTIETSHKKMLITEAARGEGGRLFYEKDDKRIYFMEEMYGPGGNLMPRDIVSKCIYDCPSQVFLDITFLGQQLIFSRLKEVYDLCKEYMGLDVTKECIPVSPSVHFFMGGIAVDNHHETNIRRLYAVGECASKYHGANRLGGNSLLAAIHSGRVAAMSSPKGGGAEGGGGVLGMFENYISKAASEIASLKSTPSKFPATYILREISDIMNNNLGITRDDAGLSEGIAGIDYYMETLSKIKFDPEVSVYENYRLYYMALLAKGILLCARARKESRGAHIRTDYPETEGTFKKCSYLTYDGDFRVEFK